LKRVFYFRKLAILTGVILLFSYSIFAEDYNLSDVINAQQSNMDQIETKSETVEIENISPAGSSVFKYDYTVQVDPATSKKKTLFSADGKFPMQFMFDESDMSVTYLMGNGTTMKVTLTAEHQSQIEELMGANTLFGKNSNMFASNKSLKEFASDAGMDASINSPEIETADLKIKVDRNRSNKDWAVVEYHNKGIFRVKENMDRKIIETKNKIDKKKKTKELRGRLLKLLEDNRDRVTKQIVAKRVEKINMKTGMVEEQEMFNEEGKKVGWFSVRKKNKLKAYKGKKHTAPVDAAFVGPSKQEEIEVEVEAESEGEMESALGKSKFRIKTSNVRINEIEDMTWRSIKKTKSTEGTGIRKEYKEVNK